MPQWADLYWGVSNHDSVTIKPVDVYYSCIVVHGCGKDLNMFLGVKRHNRGMNSMLHVLS